MLLVKSKLVWNLICELRWQWWAKLSFCLIQRIQPLFTNYIDLVYTMWAPELWDNLQFTDAGCYTRETNVALVFTFTWCHSIFQFFGAKERLWRNLYSVKWFTESQRSLSESVGGSRSWLGWYCRRPAEKNLWNCWSVSFYKPDAFHITQRTSEVDLWLCCWEIFALLCVVEH